jgi:hypothetical protein
MLDSRTVLASLCGLVTFNGLGRGYHWLVPWCSRLLTFFLANISFACEDIGFATVSGASRMWFLFKRVGKMISRMGCCPFLHLVLA